MLGFQKSLRIDSRGDNDDQRGQWSGKKDQKKTDSIFMLNLLAEAGYGWPHPMGYISYLNSTAKLAWTLSLSTGCKVMENIQLTMSRSGM